MNHAKPWRAECKVDYHTHFLGYHSTKGEAIAAERQFRLEWTGKETWGHNDCICPSHKSRRMAMAF